MTPELSELTAQLAATFKRMNGHEATIVGIAKALREPIKRVPIVGTCPSQDIDASAANYNRRASFEVRT
jgi:predicted oxidoreductase